MLFIIIVIEVVTLWHTEKRASDFLKIFDIHLLSKYICCNRAQYNLAEAGMHYSLFYLFIIFYISVRNTYCIVIYEWKIKLHEYLLLRELKW